MKKQRNVACKDWKPPPGSEASRLVHRMTPLATGQQCRKAGCFFFLDKMAHQLHQHFLILLPSLSAHLLPETVLGKPKLESHKANCKARLRSSPMSNGVTAGSLARNKFPQARQRAWCSLFPQSHPLPYLVQSKRGAGTCVLLGSGMQQCLPRWKHFILKTEGSP